MSESRTHFRLCSSCKQELPFGSTYYVCSVSTCNRKRTGLSFCSVPCFEAHVPMMNHREAWAEEKRAPTQTQWEAEQDAEEEKERRREVDRERRRVVGAGAPEERGPLQLSDDVPHDILVVVSKLKAYVKARSGLRTSDTLLEPLSDVIRQVVDDAIERAHADGRNTVMDRDL